MTLQISENGNAELVGVCDSGDAEVLLRRLVAYPGTPVDWRGCDSAHAAVFQVMLVAGVVPLGPPRGRFLTEMLEPLLKRR